MCGNKIGNKQQHNTALDWPVAIREARFNGARNKNNVALILPEIQLSYTNVRNSEGDKKYFLSLVPIFARRLQIANLLYFLHASIRFSP